jgi:hypothetical protein
MAPSSPLRIAAYGATFNLPGSIACELGLGMLHSSVRPLTL